MTGRAGSLEVVGRCWKISEPEAATADAAALFTIMSAH